MTCQPSAAAVVYQCTVTVSPACMTSGFLGAALSVSMALKAATSMKWPGFFPGTTLNTGEQAVKTLGALLTAKPPPLVQRVTIESG